MSCEHAFIQDNEFSVCREYGFLGGIVLESRDTSQSHPWGKPLGNKSYTHGVRFKKLLNMLLMLSNPPLDNIFEYIETCDIKSIPDIRLTLKKNRNSK